MRPEWIIALATIVYAVFTGWIILEMRRDRKLAHKPILAVALIGATYPHWLLFRIKNAGRGPALRCVFICKDNDMLDWKVKEKVLPIGAGETLELKLEHELGGSWRPGERIFLDVKYSDIFGKIYEGRLLEIDTNAVMQGFGVA